jgi:hypothetical protein
VADQCVMCGSAVPRGQRTCSMCYGDPDHGRDGYYRQWIEQQRDDDRDEYVPDAGGRDGRA